MTDLVTAVTRYKTAYAALFALTTDYPAEKREQPGACGHWSSQQTLAHMCGWNIEAGKYFDALVAGETPNEQYDDLDGINDGFVTARVHMTWDEILAELRQLNNTLLKRAIDSRPYRGWINQLAKDCEHHTEHLREFLEAE